MLPILNLTVADLIRLEPRLARLVREARLVRLTPALPCGNAHWPAFKRRLGQLVGWDRSEAGPAELFGCEAFSLASDAILAALPPCPRRCGCL